MVQFLVRRHWISPVSYVVQSMVLNAAWRAPGAKSGMPAEHYGKGSEDDAVDQVLIEHDGVYLPAANEPDILARLFLELADKGGDVARNKPNVLSVREVGVSCENVVGFVGVRKLLDRLRNLVGSAPHQRSVDGVIEISIAVIRIAPASSQSISPFGLAMYPSGLVAI